MLGKMLVASQLECKTEGMRQIWVSKERKWQWLFWREDWLFFARPAMPKLADFFWERPGVSRREGGNVWREDLFLFFTKPAMSKLAEFFWERPGVSRREGGNVWRDDLFIFLQSQLCQSWQHSKHGKTKHGSNKDGRDDVSEPFGLWF